MYSPFQNTLKKIFGKTLILSILSFLADINEEIMSNYIFKVFPTKTVQATFHFRINTFGFQISVMFNSFPVLPCLSLFLHVFDRSIGFCL